MPVQEVTRRLPRARPDAVGVDPGGVIGFLEAQAQQGLELRSLMFLRHGQVFAEAWWDPYTAHDAGQVLGISNTLTSAAVGLAVADGVLGYDDLLVDHFADVLPERVGERTRTIRVRDCLTMATGHLSDPAAPLERLQLAGRTPWAHFLAAEPEGVPGQDFHYNRWATLTLAELVRQSTGRDVWDLLRERVLTPLGGTHGVWERDPRGRIPGYTGLHLTTEEVAAFFQLLADGGQWDGVRLLPEEWVREHGRAQVRDLPGTDPDWTAGYGWQVWRNSTAGYRADGLFGQFAIVLPDQDVLLVMTGATTRMQAVLDNVWFHLLPAVDRPVSRGVDELRARLERRRLEPVWGERGAVVRLAFENRRNRWRLTDDPHGWQLRWVDAAGGDNTIALGHGAWRRSVMNWRGRELPVAASGGWVGWGRFEARIVTLNSPHRVTVRLRDDGSGSFDWALTPSPDGLAALALPRPSSPGAGRRHTR